MATLDRIDPAFTQWTPSAAGMATETEGYIGRHRADARRASMLRMFYTPRHRERRAR